MAAYNAVPVLVIGPLVGYCYRYVERLGLWAFVAAGLPAYAWPAVWLRRLQLSGRAAVYRRLSSGVSSRTVTFR
ncbi:hypothetical protein GCM10023172_05620 [Hymenobacter ginsengisoli]|uniref:Uncharacterized protein n=1 Tax=Hymenobacter ginsengisoli TaxID=1051626 RepID=A0ABP8PXP4_9BACT